MAFKITLLVGVSNNVYLFCPPFIQTEGKISGCQIIISLMPRIITPHFELYRASISHTEGRVNPSLLEITNNIYREFGVECQFIMKQINAYVGCIICNRWKSDKLQT